MDYSANKTNLASKFCEEKKYFRYPQERLDTQMRKFVVYFMCYRVSDLRDTSHEHRLEIKSDGEKRKELINMAAKKKAKKATKRKAAPKRKAAKSKKRA